MAKMKIAPADCPLVKAECLRLIVTLKLDPAKMQPVSGSIDTYLYLNRQEELSCQSLISTMELQEQQQIMEITTGCKEQGRVEGKTAPIIRLLNQKLGSSPETTSARTKSLELSQLDLLTEELLGFETLEDLNLRLNNF